MMRFFVRTVLAVVFAVGAAFFFQGCYVKFGEKTILGKEDVSLPGAKLESGCVMSVKKGTSAYPPEPSDVRFSDSKGLEFNRYVPMGTKVEVGKCYQWKMKLGNPMTPWWPEVNEATLLEIEP